VRWLLFPLLILLIPKRNAVTVVPDRSPGEDAEIPAPGIDELSIVVDIANVMGARPDGWWKDRAGAAARLCREVAGLSLRGLAASDLPPGLPGVAGDGDRAYPHWVLVLEGAARKAAMDDGSESHQSFPGPGPASRLVLAPGSGDDAIVAQARDLQGCCLVVTADRELRLRCEQAGAIIAGPRWLLALL
jgi:8-oxo-dGTP diphosphatase